MFPAELQHSQQRVLCDIGLHTENKHDLTWLHKYMEKAESANLCKAWVTAVFTLHWDQRLSQEQLNRSEWYKYSPWPCSYMIMNVTLHIQVQQSLEI